MIKNISLVFRLYAGYTLKMFQSYKHICNFRDLIYAQSAFNTPKRKQSLKSHHLTPLILIMTLAMLEQIRHTFDVIHLVVGWFGLLITL